MCFSQVTYGISVIARLITLRMSFKSLMARKSGAFDGSPKRRVTIVSPDRRREKDEGRAQSEANHSKPGYWVLHLFPLQSFSNEGRGLHVEMKQNLNLLYFSNPTQSWWI